MRFRPVLLLALVLAAAGCGGSAGSGGGAASGGGKLVTKVQHAAVKLEGSSVVGTVEVTEGGQAGQHLTLRYGLVDAVSGVRASAEEKLAARYTSTGSVQRKDVTIRFAKPATPTDYLLHFVLYGPDGSYLASSDSAVFTIH